MLKALIDYYKQNNRLLDEIEKSGITKEAIESDEVYQDFARRLNKSHLRFVVLKKELFDVLEKELPELSNQDCTGDGT